MPPFVEQRLHALDFDGIQIMLIVAGAVFIVGLACMY